MISLAWIILPPNTWPILWCPRHTPRIPTTAEEAVRLTNRLPGTANGGVSSRNHIRGGEVNEVLFLLDVLSFHTRCPSKQEQAIATIVNSGAIGGMDFYTGAYPAHFGDRMSGVLSIELREPEKPSLRVRNTLPM